MTINMVADLQKYRDGNTYNVNCKNYGDGDCLLDLDEMLGSGPTMVARYVKAASERLAAAEFDRLGLAIAD
jgi:hypothetical protein